MRDKIYYFVHLNEKLNDGGTSRNAAFNNFFKDKNDIVNNVFLNNKLKRVIKAILVLFFFISKKNKTIFIHQGTIIYLFPMSILRFNIAFKLLFAILHRTSNRNKLIVEVNDLPYEQAIDLELNIDKLDLKFENALYSLAKCNYIFASVEMAKFVKNMHKINNLKFEILINGSNELIINNNIKKEEIDIIDSEKINFVYAGTLNKGRQVEDLIMIFKELKKFNLYLLGEWGEWLNEYNLPENVYYMGNHTNNDAQYIVSKCDIGLIQYNSERFYYNLCFPTKISFYLSAGIPVLSTPLKELMGHFKKSTNFVFFKELSEWSNFMQTLDTEFIKNAKINVEIEKNKYYWSTIFSYSKFLNS